MIDIKKGKQGTTIRASGKRDCRALLEAMGHDVTAGAAPVQVDAPISVAALHAAMTTKAAERNPQIAAAAWNNAVSVGTWVEYREVIGLSDPKRFKTRTHAEVLSGHSAVVWLEGKSGCVLCTHCTPVFEEGGEA